MNTTFPPGKSASELNIDTTREFELVAPNGDSLGAGFKRGDILLWDSYDIKSDLAPLMKRKSDGSSGCFSISELAYASQPPGFHKGGLIPGKTIVIDEDGDRALVLEVGETTFLISDWNDFDYAASHVLYARAKKRGWQIKGEPQEVLDEQAKTEEQIREFEEWANTNQLGMSESIIKKAREIFGNNS